MVEPYAYVYMQKYWNTKPQLKKRNSHGGHMAAQIPEQNFPVSIYIWRKTCKGKFYSPPRLSWFFRFLHDVDVKWKDTEDMQLMKYLKPVFYFRITITVLLASEAMSTDIYCKQTDKFQYFSPRSIHPRHCKWNGFVQQRRKPKYGLMSCGFILKRWDTWM